MGSAPEEKLAAAMGGRFEGALLEKIAEFGGLLTRGAALRLLCQENGISTEEKIMLSQARLALLPFSFSARVGRAFPTQHFPGGSAKSMRLHIFDASGEATLVLWNEQAEAAQGGIFAGDGIECTGAHFRAGEISLGRRGTVMRAGKGGMLAVSELRGGVCNVQGTVGGVASLRTYADKRSGERKSMLAFSLSSGGQACRAVWWSPPADAPMLREGDEVALESVNFRGGEIHINGFSRVAVQGRRGEEGEFRGVSFEGEAACLSIGAEKFSASIGEALSLLGVAPAPGVQPQTLLLIKSSALAGRAVSYSAEGGRLISLKPKA